MAVSMASDMCLDIHLHITLHHSICIHKHSSRHMQDNHHHGISVCFGKKKKRKKELRGQKESFGKKGNVVFYASLRTKRREGVFTPSAQKKKISSTSKHFSQNSLKTSFSYIYKSYLKSFLSLSTVYSYLISKELQLRRHFLIIGFGFVILHELNCCKSRSSLKEEVSTRYDFLLVQDDYELRLQPFLAHLLSISFLQIYWRYFGRDQECRLGLMVIK